MATPDSADNWREKNKAFATRWVEKVAGALSDEEATSALADLVCWIVLVGGKIALPDLTKELIRRT